MVFPKKERRKETRKGEEEKGTERKEGEGRGGERKDLVCFIPVTVNMTTSQPGPQDHTPGNFV